MYRQKGNEHVFFLLNEKNKKDETTTKKTTQILNAKKRHYIKHGDPLPVMYVSWMFDREMLPKFKDL